MCGSLSWLGAGPQSIGKDKHLVFDLDLTPIREVSPGSSITVETLDCVAGVISRPEHTISHVDDLIETLGGMNYVTGPIAVNTVRAGDVVRVTIEDIEPAPDTGKGFIALAPGFGSLVHDNGMGVQESLKPVTTICSVSRDEVVLPFESGDVRLPCEPFIGTIGIAPRRERRMTLSQSPDYVGDIDIPQFRVGSSLHMRANHDMGLLSVGDVHAVQGDGEFGGIAVEIAAQVTLRIDVVPAEEASMQRLPLLTDDQRVGVVAAFQGTPTSDCVRAAGVQLVELLVSFGMKLEDAIQYLSAAAKVRLGNMFEPFYSAYVYVDRSNIPVQLPEDLAAEAAR
jgi:amidase